MVRALVPWRICVNRIVKAVVFLLAAIYFMADAIFLTFAKALANWIAEHWMFENLRVWIVSLPRLGAVISRPVLGGLHHQYCRI
jgi:hypothetical protein